MLKSVRGRILPHPNPRYESRTDGRIFQNGGFEYVMARLNHVVFFWEKGCGGRAGGGGVAKKRRVEIDMSYKSR